MSQTYMNGLIYFTVAGNFKSVVADLPDDPDYDPTIAEITATVTFTPLLNPGDLILAVQADPPTSIAPVAIVGMIDSDGVLKLRRDPDVGGDGPHVPVRLLANQPKLGLATALAYRVSFTNVRFAGKPGSIRGFAFVAPSTDCVLDLASVAAEPGQPAVGIVRVAPGGVRLADDGRVVFTFAGEDIPDPLELEVLHGPAGEPGPPGVQGLQGVQGVQGPQGEAGVSLDIEGTVATYADLPANPKPGDAFVVAADGLLYFYDGTSWPAKGAGVPFRGPQGLQGVQGVQGERGPAGVSDWAGITGKPTDLVTLAGAQTLTGKTISGASNTLSAIPKTALDPTVQTSLTKADTALQTLPTVPRTSLDTSTQASLTKADTALQALPTVPRSSLDTSTQASLAKADTALQTAPVTSVAGRGGAVTLAVADVAGAVAGSNAGVAQALTLWTGTQAQYDAIGSKSATTVYVIA